ncbi:MAG: hypothetical protein WC438_04955 [Candidatus Pacearchaeota archaeon]
MKIWLKAGLIGAGIYLLITIIGIYFSSILLLLSLPLILISPFQSTFFIFIFSLIIGFIIGAVIGLIIKKVKGGEIKKR